MIYDNLSSSKRINVLKAYLFTENRFCVALATAILAIIESVHDLIGPIRDLQSLAAAKSKMVSRRTLPGSLAASLASVVAIHNSNSSAILKYLWPSRASFNLSSLPFISSFNFCK